jgi:hypothetical protein
MNCLRLRGTRIYPKSRLCSRTHQEECRGVIDFIAQVEPSFGALYPHFTQTRLIRVVPLMHRRDVTLLVELIHDGQ